jgi:hypothetical protein
MSTPEASEETQSPSETAGAVDLLIAVAGPLSPSDFRGRLESALSAQLSSGLQNGAQSDAKALTGLGIVVAYPGSGPAGEAASKIADRLEPANEGSGVRYLQYSLPGTTGVISWLGSPSTYQALFAIARELNARACVVLAPDLEALEVKPLVSLTSPILGERCDLVMPIYAMGKYEGLLNTGVIAPLNRALYGRRVRFPLAQDFAVSAQLLAEFEQPIQKIGSQANSLFWPSTEAARGDRKICQAHIGVRHESIAEGIDLSTLLAQTIGPLFADMEVNAPVWQRIRGSQLLQIVGATPNPTNDGTPADIRPMLDTFTLASRNLQEVWGLVLPPVTLLEIKRLTRMSPETFSMPDELWVRIVYDFALAYRLRTLNRSHLMGAFTPLYLGWVASHVSEVGRMHTHEVDARAERLARAYEEGKPYLLSRWRWPDRFNP